MKFTISRIKFLEALQKVQNVVGSRSTLQILSNALIRAEGGRLYLTTTDLEMSVKCEVEAETVEEGITTLPVKRLLAIVRELGEQNIELSIDDNDVTTLQCGSSFFKIIGLPAANFPPIPNFSESYSYRLEVATLRDMIRKTSYAASNDETRRALTGILMSFKDGKLTMVATDGRRLAMAEHEVEFAPEAENEFVLPGKTAAELMHLLAEDGDLRISAEKGQVIFEIGGTTLSSKLIDSNYPNYRQVIPAGCDERAVMVREEVLTALRRVSLMKSDKSGSAQLSFHDNRLTVIWANVEVGEARDTVPIKYTGKEITMTFNPEYVMDPLRNLDADEISFEMSNSHSPALIKCNQPFIYVLMPLRVN